MSRSKLFKVAWKKFQAKKGKAKPKAIGGGIAKQERKFKSCLLIRRKYKVGYIRRVYSESLINREVIAHKLSNPENMPFLHLTFKKIE